MIFSLLIHCCTFNSGASRRVTSWNQEFTSNDIDFSDNKSLRLLWRDWKVSFDREYSSIEQESHRYSIWMDNLIHIVTHNDDKDTTYKLRLNQFGDLTNIEFSSRFDNNYNYKNDKTSHYVTDNIKTVVKDNPSSIDWTDVNGTSYVSPVKDQGEVDDAWVYSIVSSVECRYAIANNEKPQILSEEQVVDCCSDCTDLASSYKDYYEYIINDKGLCTEKFSII